MAPVIRLLLVDDSPEFVEQAEGFLSRLPGVAFLGWCFTAHDAFDLMRRVDVDVVVMDLMMPGMSGLQATRELKRRAGSHATRVVIVSFNASPAHRAAALKAGADGFIDKARLMSCLPSLLAALFQRGNLCMR